MQSTAEVLDHHLKAFAARDVPAVMADYSPDALFFGSAGAVRGPDAIRLIFENFFAEFAKPGRSFTMKQQLIEGDYAFIVWSAETADNSYELATDTFVIQKGSIQFQTFIAKVTPKH
jgi:ketosteroid isomerase-like protein